MFSLAGPCLSGQETEKVIQAYRKCMTRETREWMTNMDEKQKEKQIYSLSRNYRPERPIHGKRVREVKATRRFLWEKALKSGEKVLGCNRCQKYWACNWIDKDAPFQGCGSLPAAPGSICTARYYLLWYLLQYRVTLYGNNLTATHSQAVSVILCNMTLPWDRHVLLSGEGSRQDSPLCFPFLLFDLPSSLSQHLAIILCLKTCHGRWVL